MKKVWVPGWRCSAGSVYLGPNGTNRSTFSKKRSTCLIKKFRANNSSARFDGVGPKSTHERHEHRECAPIRASLRAPYFTGQSLQFASVAPFQPPVPVAPAEPVSASWQQQWGSNTAKRDVMPAETVKNDLGETLGATKPASAPSKKLGMSERLYSEADIREMLRLKLTDQVSSAQAATERLGLPSARTALKRFLTSIYSDSTLVRLLSVFNSVANSSDRR